LYSVCFIDCTAEQNNSEAKDNGEKFSPNTKRSDKETKKKGGGGSPQIPSI